MLRWGGCWNVCGVTDCRGVSIMVGQKVRWVGGSVGEAVGVIVGFSDGALPSPFDGESVGDGVQI